MSSEIRGLERFADLVPLPETVASTPVNHVDANLFETPLILDASSEFQPDQIESPETGINSPGLRFAGSIDRRYTVVQYPDGRQTVLVPDEPENAAPLPLSSNKGGHVYVGWDEGYKNIETSSKGKPEDVLQGLLGVTPVVERMTGQTPRRASLLELSAGPSGLSSPKYGEAAVDETPEIDEFEEDFAEPAKLRVPNEKELKIVKSFVITVLGMYAMQKSYGFFSHGDNFFTVSLSQPLRLFEHPVNNVQDIASKFDTVIKFISLGHIG